MTYFQTTVTDGEPTANHSDRRFPRRRRVGAPRALQNVTSSRYSPLYRLEVVQKRPETATAFKQHGAEAPVVHGNGVRLILKELRRLRGKDAAGFLSLTPDTASKRRRVVRGSPVSGGDPLLCSPDTAACRQKRCTGCPDPGL